MVVFAWAVLSMHGIDISVGRAAESTPTREQAESQEEGPHGVVNYTRVDATVGCAGATPPAAMAGLKKLGFTSVINFRTSEERGATVEEGLTQLPRVDPV